ncbi:ribosomal protein L1 [Dendrothele bispora CBS 962.96]|uniref:Ribosomal protein L1 n=1 Tax=Dendrothele bispora (strain CBS 962.96) TaxID=1314807 RepID=A0A4S8MTM6_DENBC|nr:ribosomal protein L1 [Dendrothele bispora CBS 962.96]
MSLFSLSRQCCRTSIISLAQHRTFSSTAVSLARRQNAPKIRIPSKKALAAKQKRRAAKAALKMGKLEQLSLTEAISVLRSVEVDSPKSVYELYIKTEMGNGVAVPKGRFKLPKEVKAQAEDHVLVFAEGRLAEEAKKAGAHIVGGLELIEGIINNRIRATTYLCTTSLIRAITPRLGRFLGPQGLMPSERRGTVTDDIAGYMGRIQGTSEWRADKQGNIHMPIGTVSFNGDDVVKNFKHFMLSVKKATGNVKDGKNKDGKQATVISKVLLSSTQGPSIRILDY